MMRFKAMQRGPAERTPCRRATPGLAITLLAAGSLPLAGCGGIDATVAPPSSASSTPTTAPTLGTLTTNQNFANNAATSTATIVNSTANVSASGSTADTMTIAYNVSANSYTITTQGRTQTFGASNLVSAANGIAIYSTTSGSTTDRLTLESATITGYGSTYPQYSGLGYWQRTTTGASTSDVSVDFFLYGLASTAAEVPRTGQAAYATSVYGVVAQPGTEARFFQGSGRMDVNFASALFTTSETASETGIVSGSNYGSGVTINGSGTLSSTANALTGTITYTGNSSASTGTMAGQFYGPTAQELGAAFTTSGADGSTTSGVIWGNQNSSLAATNLTLTTVVADQTFTASDAVMTTATGTTPTTAASTASIEVEPGGTTVVSPAGLPSATFTSSNAVTGSNANFTAYSQAYGSGTIALDLYKAGSSNTELALTYSDFGSWTGPTATGSASTATAWFVYGLGTDAAVIQARTGSASYAGVAYGTAYNSSTGTSATVSGTAAFNVNFDMMGYSGSFGLKNANTNYGTFNTTGAIAAGVAQVGGVTGVTAGTGTFSPTFYGPTGQEFGGPFQIAIPGQSTTIVGAAVGKSG
jgi:hypothetical protein